MAARKLVRGLGRRANGHRPKRERWPCGRFLLRQREHLHDAIAERAFVSAMPPTAARKRTSRDFRVVPQAEVPPGSQCKGTNGMTFH
jgi:hypothetical protein